MFSKLDFQQVYVPIQLVHCPPWDGTEKLVAFASRTLAPAEKNYSQLDREALAIMFGVKRFHSYLYGRHFQIYSDHQQLRYLL